MISTRPPCFRGEVTRLKPQDVIVIERSQGTVSFMRRGEPLEFNSFPIDGDTPRRSIRCAEKFDVGFATNVFKVLEIFAHAGGFELKFDGEDGNSTRYQLVVPATAEVPM